MVGRCGAVLVIAMALGGFGQLASGTTFTLSREALTRLDFNQLSLFGSEATIVSRVPSGAGVEFTLRFTSNRFPSDTMHVTSHAEHRDGALSGLAVGAYEAFSLRFTLLSINNQQPSSMGVVVGALIGNPDGGTASTTDNRSISFSTPTAVSTTVNNTATVGFIGFVLGSSGLPANGGTVRVLVEPAPAAVQLPVAPSTDSIAPFAGTAMHQTFAAVYSDSDGWSDIAYASLVFNTTLENRVGGCFIQYSVAENAFRLYNDAATGWVGPVAAGSPMDVENNQCRVNTAASTAFGTGTRLTLNIAVSFKPAFTGKRSIYMFAEDRTGGASLQLCVGAWWPGAGTGVPVNRYRLFNPFSRSHHHTTDLNEYDTLGSWGFRQEGIGSRIYNLPGTLGGVTATPLYRIYNMPGIRHFWTADRNEYLSLINWFPHVYRGEGIDGFVFPTPVPGTSPLYRLVFNFETPVIHHWTADLNEYTVLGNTDAWAQEGIAGYILPVQ